MTSLLLFAWRELVRAKGRAALVAVVLALQAAALGGGFVADRTLRATRDAHYRELRHADLDVRVVPATPAEMPSLDALRRIPGVRAVDRRFVAMGYVERASGEPLPVMIHYLDPASHPAVDDVRVLTGSFLSAGRPEDALVDRSFADAQGVRIGDELVVDPKRFATRLRVVGTALSAEYLVPTANPEQLVALKGSVGIVYASRETLDRRFADPLFNDLVFVFDDGTDPRATADLVLAALAPLEIEHVSTKTSSFGHRYIDELLAGSRLVMPTTALILAAMTMIVTFLSVHRLVTNRRRELGCLLAQGFSARAIVAALTLFGLVPGLLGAAAGVPLALCFGDRLASTTAAITGFPAPTLAWSSDELAWAAMTAALVGVVSAAIPALAVSKLRPSHALRGAGEVRETIFPAWVERVLPSSAPARYALRNLARRPALSFAAVSVVALAIAMPASLLTSLGSWEAWVHAKSAALPWDAVATFKVPIATDHAAQIVGVEGVASHEGYVQAYASVERDGEPGREMRVRGVEAAGRLARLDVADGSWLSADDADEAVLNGAFTRGQRPPRVGETILVATRNGKRALRVVGLVREASMGTVFVPVRTAQKMFGLEGKVSGALLTYGRGRARAAATPTRERPADAEIIDGDDAPALAAPAIAPARAPNPKTALLEDELVSSVQVKAEFTDATLRYLAAFNVVIVPFVGLATALAFAFLVGVVGFLLLEREQEYATLRAMGFGRLDVARVVMTEVGALAALGLTASVLAWAIAAYVVREPMAQAWLRVPLDFRVRDYVSVACPTFGLLTLSALPGIRRLLGLDLAATLRAREMG